MAHKENGKPGHPVAPRAQQVRAFLEHHKASRKSAELARRHVGRLAIGQHEGAHGLGVEIRIGDELRAQHIGDLPAGKLCRGGRAGDDLAEIINQRKNPVLGHRACRQRLRQQLRRQGADRLSVRHIGGKRRNDFLCRQFRLQNGEAVLLGQMAAAALQELRRERNAQSEKKQRRENHDQPAQGFFGNCDAPPAGQGRGQAQRALPEEQFSDLCLTQDEIPLNVARKKRQLKRIWPPKTKSIPH